MRIITLITGSILLLLGILSLATPIPGGVLVLAVGAGMVICTSETAARKLREFRTKHARINRLIVWMEAKMGDRLSAPLRGTRPIPEKTQVTVVPEETVPDSLP